METAEKRIAFILAMIAGANAEIEGMKAENMERIQQGKSIAYGENDFFSVPERYGITHNNIIEYLRDV